MTFEIVKWLIAAMSLVGVVLNIKHDQRCFVIWFFTNASWAVIDLFHGVYAQAFLQSVYCCLSVWGWWSWRKNALTRV